MTDLPLASVFPATTSEAWRALVDGVLKGAEFERKLVSRTHDGIRIEPLYPKAEPRAPVERGTTGPWRVAQRIDHPDPAEASALALADLEGGADALVLVHRGAPTARGGGVRADTLDCLDRALRGVMLDLVQLRVEAAPHAGRLAAAQVAALAARRGHDLGRLDLDLGLDPLGDMARTGAAPGGWAVLREGLARTHGELRGLGVRGPVLRADGRPYHEAGASEAQELAALLGTGVAYLRALDEAGTPPGEGRVALSFLAVADADEFLTVAKLRALRRLWARVEAACGLDPRPIRIHAETAWRMTTRRDPWVNMLRGTVAAFSAGIGGADGVTVLPFTAALGLPDAFARRVARNTQLVLLEEANLWRVADPAAGAGGFEALTDELCRATWAAFQEIEREGGIAASLASGALQGRIAEVRQARDRAVATRREPITGTSEFPDIREAPVAVLGAALPEPSDGPPADASAGLAQVVAAIGGGAVLPAEEAGERACDPLPSRRVAEPFERLRDASDATAARGSRPRVFLANLGPIAAFTARATFAKNFFEAAGIEAVTNDGFGSLDEMTQAWRASNAKLACLCSSDEIYALHAIEAAKALAEAGCATLYLAGKPGDLQEQLRNAGVSRYVFAGCDALAVLEEASALAA